MIRDLQLSRDLTHAARSLAKDRGFTLVCVISLGIGMGALVALATFTRAVWSPARVIDTNGLTELLVLPLGPLRAKAGVWALSQWSYPDYQALRGANTGMTLTAWVREVTPGTPDKSDEPGQPGVTTLYVSSNYFQTLGVSLARGPGFDPAIDDGDIGRAAGRGERRVLAEPVGGRSRDRREVRDARWRPAYGGRDHAARFSRPLPFLSSAGLDGVRSPRAAPTPEGESESSRRQNGRLGADPRPAQRRCEHHPGECAGLDHGRRPGAAVSRVERIQGGDGRTVRVDGCGRRPGVAARDERLAGPGGNGAPDRVPQHLRHDAGARRQP